MVDPQRIVLYTIFSLSFLLLFESTFEQQSQPLSSRNERVALFELRSSLGLRSKDWPLKAEPCFLWRGVQCENGRVVAINISGFRRTRLGRRNPQFAVDALANFTLLTSFNASNFMLPGPFPNWFGQRLRSLQVIDLRSCSVIGIIPLSLGNLTKLTSLYLSNNNLTGTIPASLGRLSRLSVLDLSQNILNGSVPPSFSNLDNLSVLDISSNSLSGSIPLGIGALSKLQSLNLSSNNLSSSVPAQLGDLLNLVELDLSFNYLSGSLPPDLRGLRNLETMAFGNNFVGGSLPNNLFSSMTKLQFIVLRHNSFTGNLPSVLWTKPALRFLDVSGNNFTGQLPNSSSNANATAAVVNISHNMFYGVLTPLLGRFNVVDLSGNYFEGRIPTYERTNFSMDHNCLQNLSNQRTLEQCASFYAERGLTFDNFGLPIPTPPPPPPVKKPGKSNRKVIILAAVLGGFGFIVLLVVMLVLWLLCVRKKGATNQQGVGVGPVPAGSSPPPPGGATNYSIVGDSFTYEQLLQATSDLSDSNLIKHGHLGDIFRGVLENGIPVAVKRINLQSVKKEAYLLELDFFSKVSHARFVSFLGHCLEKENEKFLVYKYVPNGDLSSTLYKKTDKEDDGLQSLDWITRLKIALGAAEGLSYLHHECNPPLVHRYL